MLHRVVCVEGLMHVFFDVDFTLVNLELLLRLDDPLKLIDDFFVFLL